MWPTSLVTLRRRDPRAGEAVPTWDPCLCHCSQVADQLVALLTPLVVALKVGMPEEDADITPVISETSADFIEGLVVDAREKGERS